MKTTSQPVYETTPEGKTRIGIPDDWEKFYECGVPHSPSRFGNWNPNMGTCHAVFRYESELRRHIQYNHPTWPRLNRSYLSEHMTKTS